MCEEFDDRPQISIGKLITKEEFHANQLIEPQAKAKLAKSDNYLAITVPGEEILKVSIFVVKNPKITKILIKLKDKFTPQIVEGIGDVLTEFGLCDMTVHTTGLCFSGTNCYYESYIDYDLFEEKDVTLAEVHDAFIKIGDIETVEFLDL